MNTKKNILIVTYWSYNSALIKTYTLPYIDIIKSKLSNDSTIYLLTLTAKSETALNEYEANYKELKQKNIQLINFTYSPFGFNMFVKMFGILLYLANFIYRKKVDVIHAWCTPGGAIGYVLSRLTGRPLILDSFEPHAESMLETGTWQKTGLAYRLLFILEKLQLKRAKHVICAAQGMILYSKSVYGISKENYFVKPACVDLNLFDPSGIDSSLLIPGIDEISVVCMYAGKFGDIYLSGEVFDFFAVARSFWGEKFKVLLLTNQSDDEILKFCEGSGLPFQTIIKKFVPHNIVPSYMALSNFGICPVKPVPTKKYCTPIKNGEYWAMGLPVVITKDISVDSDLIEEYNIGYVLKNLTVKEYLNAVKKIDELLKTGSIHNKIRAVAEKHRNYSIANAIYSAIYV